MHKQNLHTHTTYVDGKDAPEALLLEAIEKGFDSIGFSEHSHLPFSRSTSRFVGEELQRYCDEVRHLKEKYAGTLDVFCGLEYDYYSDLDTAGLDYLIGSVHYLDCPTGQATFDAGLAQTLAYINEHFAGNALAFAKKYYETLAAFPQKKQVDIIGHFDLVSKNNEKGAFLDTTSKAYLNMGLEAIHALRGKVPFFEVNTGAIARGYRTAPYPQIEFLRELRACGFGAVITSDCHDKQYLDHAFDLAAEYLAAVGFTSKWILTDNGFMEVAL